jgi:molybdopterin synthase sulfur carrier subunit
MIVKIKVFAGLKQYFEREFELEGKDILNIADVVRMLEQKRPDSGLLLASCRFAVSEEFVPNNYQLKNGEELYLIPPSSGG